MPVEQIKDTFQKYLNTDIDSIDLQQLTACILRLILILNAECIIVVQLIYYNNIVWYI